MIVCRHCGERLDADAQFCGVCGMQLVDPDIGRVVGGRYRILQRIGTGSLGGVYRAEQIGLGRKIALKLLSPEGKRDGTTVKRFHQEGALLSRLRSPHTVTTYEVGTEPDGAFYIAMELSPGRSLAAVLRDGGPLAWDRVLRIMAGICDSLGEAHELGVIHRGLSLHSVLVETRGATRDFVRLLDFGLAKFLVADPQLSPVGHQVGTVEYSSPEQLLREPVDARSDLYALGVLGYVLVTGMHPFHTARSVGDMVSAHIQRIPDPVATLQAVPPDVDAILSRCLEKNRERRYPDANALAASITVALNYATPANYGDTLVEPEIDLDADGELDEEAT